MRSKILLVVPILIFLLMGCGSTPQVSTSLQVTRSENLSGYNVAPIEITVNNTTAVQKLYAAAMALPTPQPGAIYHCFADIGLMYHLSFRCNMFTFKHMDLEVTGCEWLHLNQTTVRRANSSFFTLVSQTIGILCLIPTANLVC
jgi:hypothetical protein